MIGTSVIKELIILNLNIFAVIVFFRDRRYRIVALENLLRK